MWNSEIDGLKICTNKGEEIKNKCELYDYNTCPDECENECR